MPVRAHECICPLLILRRCLKHVLLTFELPRGGPNGYPAAGALHLRALGKTALNLGSVTNGLTAVKPHSVNLHPGACA